MAVFALVNESVTINSVDLSDHVVSGTLTLDSNQLDTTAMGDDWQEMIGGVKSGTLALQFHNDYAASNVDATLFAAFGTVVTFVVRPDAGAVSATNPNYSGSVLISEHAMGGQHGEVATLSVTYPTSGTVTRATS